MLTFAHIQIVGGPLPFRLAFGPLVFANGDIDRLNKRDTALARPTRRRRSFLARRGSSKEWIAGSRGTTQIGMLHGDHISWKNGFIAMQIPSCSQVSYTQA